MLYTYTEWSIMYGFKKYGKKMCNAHYSQSILGTLASVFKKAPPTLPSPNKPDSPQVVFRTHEASP